ncbi:hypothetical protein B0H14DRAFT_2525689 [Mycena olivaceomarginata]|nr:hypothetical protein B0H14DRAFT_2525689 [Mycena olivaceomarginata]
MGVVSKGPLSSQDLWTAICQRATMKLMSVYNNGCFLDDDGNECDLRFGIEYRQTAKGQIPVNIERMRNVEKVIGRIGDDPDLQAISAYQNQLYEQFFPQGYAMLAQSMAELESRKIASAEFSGSVLSTTEIHLPRSMSPRKCWDVRFDTIEVLTVLGRYNDKRRGHLISWDDGSIYDLPPGTTVLIPSGAKSRSFVPVTANEKQFIFRQYFHSSILRWIEKGGYSDSSCEREATESDDAAVRLADWEARRGRRMLNTRKTFRRIVEVYT